MRDLKTVRQPEGGSGQTGRTPPGTTDEENRAGQTGATERATRGTDDADRSGQSKNQGHGHPREERRSTRDEG
jgi:hypothetical protein